MEHRLSTRDAIRILTEALEIFQDNIDPEVPVQRILTFLAIAANPDMPQFELAQHIKGFSPATFSRNIADLTAVNRQRKPGPDLVFQQTDPMYRRRNLLRLTTKGEKLMADITRRLECALGKTRH